jgi:hypothetical protein
MMTAWNYCRPFAIEQLPGITAQQPPQSRRYHLAPEIITAPRSAQGGTNIASKRQRGWVWHSGAWHMKRIVFGLILSMVVACLVGSVRARDLDGRYANSPLKPWFDHLASGKGLCCSVADGESVADPDWESKDGHYRVRLENNWIDVPDDAVITEPNRAGRTMVWPMRFDNQISIRCFMPGSMI